MGFEGWLRRYVGICRYSKEALPGVECFCRVYLSSVEEISQDFAGTNTKNISYMNG